MKFLENPEKDWLKEYDAQLQLEFSSSYKGGLTFEIEKSTSVKSRLSESKMINLYFYRTLVF
jgi:hypothetical protein